MRESFDVTSVRLPKWPMMATVGEPVTRDQAAEIIVRCSGLYFSSNDRAWLRTIHAEIGVRMDQYGLPNLDDVDRARPKHGVLDLEYLELSDRIASAYIGGPHGWCNWDGTIGESGHNIGKWPTTAEVLEEWKTIAAAFPFLTLRCQLFSGEHGEDVIEPVVEFHVGNGEARALEPGAAIGKGGIEAPMFVGNERGCSLEDYRRGLELALASRSAPRSASGEHEHA